MLFFELFGEEKTIVTMENVNVRMNGRSVSYVCAFLPHQENQNEESRSFYFSIECSSFSRVFSSIYVGSAVYMNLRPQRARM